MANSVLSMILFVLILFFHDINGQGYTYDSTCNCASVSSNGYVCLQYTCVSTQRTVKCFPGRSVVRTENGLTKSLSNLTIGERVLVRNKENQLIYEPIEGFIHSKRQGLFDFLLIHLKFDDQQTTRTSLFISPNHLIFLANDTELKSAIFAGQLRRNDRINYFHKNRLISAIIENIYLTKEEGYYAPLTPSGTIIIDNVLVSNYATVNNHHLAHNVMQIYRWWIYIFGVIESNENIHWMLKSMERIVQWYGIENFGQSSLYNGVFQVSNLI
jgi:hypothetical protein